MVSRTDYGLSQDEVKIDTSEDWFEVDDSYDGTIRNPINPTLTNFKREFVRNERLTYEMWTQLNYLLSKFSSMVSSNPYYERMEIVNLMENIIDRYKVWMGTMRYNIHLGKEKMIEAQKVILEKYKPVYEFDKLKSETSYKLDSMEKNWRLAKCVIIGQGRRIIIPSSVRDIAEGDPVLYKKGDDSDRKRIAEKGVDDH